ncbi:MAG: hypothetical protein IPF41_03890 [Flavobacteriales bacterium]|nr:hypothetical protein [Flavobacteriales bacterium]
MYSPSVDALVGLRNLTVSSHMLINLGLIESRADAPEKTTLVETTTQRIPAALDRVDTPGGTMGP